MGALADAHHPGHTFNDRVLRADDLGLATLLDGILPIFELDLYAPPLAMVAALPGDKLDPKAEAAYWEVIRKHVPGAQNIFASA